MIAARGSGVQLMKHAGQDRTPFAVALSTHTPAAPMTHPNQCDPSQCCLVLFKGAEGEQCGPVPIWSMGAWTHPGPAYIDDRVKQVRANRSPKS